MTAVASVVELLAEEMRLVESALSIPRGNRDDQTCPQLLRLREISDAMRESVEFGPAYDAALAESLDRPVMVDKLEAARGARGDLIWGIHVGLDHTLIATCAAAVKAYRDLTDFAEIYSAMPAAPPKRRLSVSVERLTITLDGTEYDVASGQAVRWVKVLADRPGEWIAGRKLIKHDAELDGARPRQLRCFLPEPVACLIESATGKGSRIRL